MSYEGDRYKVEDTEYYTVHSTLPPALPITNPQAAIAILDEEAGGYIAFCTDEESADRVAQALNFFSQAEKGLKINVSLTITPKV